jgi:N-acetylglucosaminyldiphosphoundecaprenol N-acetyl-beta-D-mannosaminyltransferase
MRILITAPNLDESKNVSGISTVVKQIINKSSFEYIHFVAGKEDAEKRSLNWLLRQILLPLKFCSAAKKVDLIHLNTSLNLLAILRDFCLISIAKLIKKPVLLHIHGGKFLTTSEFHNACLKKLTKKMLEKADVVLVLSQKEKEMIENKFEAQKLKVLFLENSVEFDEKFSTQKIPNSIIYLGRLEESKGLHELVEAMKILASDSSLSFTFKAFGAGRLQNYFISEMKKALGERFHFGGVISGEQKKKLLAESDIFVLPSRYGEGLPMAMLEAMAYGCIIVASEMASVGEVISDGVNGFLIQPQNTSELVEKLKIALKIDDKFKQKLRQNARETIKSHFNIENYIKRLEKIYQEELIKKHKTELNNENLRLRVLSLFPNITSLEKVIERVEKLIELQKGGYICFSTVHMVMEAYDDPEFAHRVNSADYIVTDGMPIVWMQKLQGAKEASRVRANDLMIELCRYAEKKGFSVGFYGSKPSVLEKILQRARKEFPNLKIVYAFSPPFRELSQQEDEEIIKAIKESDPDILFVGLGCPKQENWMAKHKGRLRTVMLGVGASFDFFAGNVKECPNWLGKLGLEWLFRLLQEPKRLWRRYLILNPRFIYLATLQLLKNENNKK